MTRWCWPASASNPGEYVIGRDETCQVVIDVEGMGAQHARLRVGEQVVAGRPRERQRHLPFRPAGHETRRPERARRPSPSALAPESCGWSRAIARPSPSRRRSRRSPPAAGAAKSAPAAAMTAFRELEENAPLEPGVSKGQGWEIWAPGSLPDEDERRESP